GGQVPRWRQGAGRRLGRPALAEGASRGAGSGQVRRHARDQRRPLGARRVRHPRRDKTARRKRDLGPRAPAALFRAGGRPHRRDEGARPRGRGRSCRATGPRVRARKAVLTRSLGVRGGTAPSPVTVSLKEDALVLVTEDDGGLPLGASSPLGLYYHDTQYLSGYGLRVNGTRPILLSANTEQNYVATFQLMHSEGATLGTARHAAETLSIRRTRFLADGLRERVGVLNANAHPVDIEVELEFEAAFRDMFAVRAYRDHLSTEPLASTRGPRESGPFPTGGIPWYAVPFGRDGLISAYQTLGWNPDVARGTLRLLASYQGQKVDDYTEEEPGKIFHELRRGELARLGEIPHRPYYGSIDSTPLFALIFAETVKWTGDRSLWRELLPAAERAL